ncbi:unnamed protein product, partial [Owenia fusiformis]
ERYIMTDDQTNNFAHFGAGHNLNDVIVMSDVQCNGDEHHLSECSYNHGLNISCEGHKRVTVFCELRIETLKKKINRIKIEETLITVGKLEPRYFCVDKIHATGIMYAVCRQKSQQIKDIRLMNLSVLSRSEPAFIAADCRGGEESILECNSHLVPVCTRSLAIVKCMH